MAATYRPKSQGRCCCLISVPELRIDIDVLITGNIKNTPSAWLKLYLTLVAAHSLYGSCTTECLPTVTVGEISIEHINILSSKCISNEPIQVKFEPDFGINSNNPHERSKH